MTRGGGPRGCLASPAGGRSAARRAAVKAPLSASAGDGGAGCSACREPLAGATCCRDGGAANAGSLGFRSPAPAGELADLSLSRRPVNAVPPPGVVLAWRRPQPQARSRRRGQEECGVVKCISVAIDGDEAKGPGQAEGGCSSAVKPGRAGSRIAHRCWPCRRRYGRLLWPGVGAVDRGIAVGTGCGR